MTPAAQRAFGKAIWRREADAARPTCPIFRAAVQNRRLYEANGEPLLQINHRAIAYDAIHDCFRSLVASNLWYEPAPRYGERMTLQEAAEALECSLQELYEWKRRRTRRLEAAKEAAGELDEPIYWEEIL